MPLPSTTLRPGVLVSLKTTVRGGVSYDKRIIDSETIMEDGAALARWETARTVADPDEYEAAKKARSGAAGLIRRVCAGSSFGLLCPENNIENLEAAIADARKIIGDFNASARLSQIGLYVITGRIAPDDDEAVRAINSEVRDLMTEMQQGIADRDAKVIREAASRARNLGAMLAKEAETGLRIAIDTAREAAKQIVKDGDGGRVDQSAIRKIAEQQTSFLDLGEAAPVAAPVARAAGELDLGEPTVREDIGYKAAPAARAR